MGGAHGVAATAAPAKVGLVSIRTGTCILTLTNSGSSLGWSETPLFAAQTSPDWIQNLSLEYTHGSKRELSLHREAFPVSPRGGGYGTGNRTQVRKRVPGSGRPRPCEPSVVTPVSGNGVVDSFLHEFSLLGGLPKPGGNGC